MMISAIRKRGMVMPRKDTKREQRIDPAILARRGEDAEADADDRGEEMAGERQCQIVAAGAADHLADGPVVEEAMPEIDPRRYPPIQLKYCSGSGSLRPCSLRIACAAVRLLVRGAALVDQHVRDIVAIVAGRCLDDGEGHHAQHEEHRNGRKDSNIRETAA